MSEQATSRQPYAWVRGTDLNWAVQAHAQMVFAERYTGEHCPAWLNGRPFPLHFASDAEWLAHTMFATIVMGGLDLTFDHCHSIPTWPNNPELRTALN